MNENQGVAKYEWLLEEIFATPWLTHEQKRAFLLRLLAQDDMYRPGQVAFRNIALMTVAGRRVRQSERTWDTQAVVAE